MAKHPLIQYVHKAALVHNDQVSDGQLLEQFLFQRNEEAFALLVHRYGPMVMGVCRRVLNHSQDAEDAFQATFLVLVRKADSIVPREKVGSWLSGVAYRTALEAKTIRARRKAKEAQVPARTETNPTKESGSELRAELDRHLHGLPEKYRLPILLCDLQGKTQQEAAKQLGWPEGTVSGRLFRARQLLAKRLKDQGIVVSAATLPTLLSQEAWSATVPSSLINSTVKAASACLSGSALTTSVVSPQVLNLVEGVIRTMWMKRMKTVVASVVFLALLATFVGAFAVKMLASPPEISSSPNQLGSQGKNSPEGKKPLTADQLVQKMEGKLTRTKTLQCNMNLTLEFGKKRDQLTAKGKLITKEPNQVRLEMTIGVPPQPMQIALISDGEKVKRVDNEKIDTTQARNNQRQFLLVSLARPGLTMPLFSVQANVEAEDPKQFTPKVNPEKAFLVSNARFGKDAKVGEKSAKVVQYKCDLVTLKTTTDVTVWIDPKTDLPLKRVIVGKDQNQIVTITELYSNWVVDAPIDPKQFQVDGK